MEIIAFAAISTQVAKVRFVVKLDEALYKRERRGSGLSPAVVDN